MTSADSNVSVLWEKEYYRDVNVLTVSDIDGDGSLETVVGAGGGVYVLDNNGHVIWGYKGYTEVSQILADDIDNDNEEEIIGATWLDVFALETDGSYKWSYHLSDFAWYFEETVVRLADIDHDGINEVVVAHNENVYAFQGDGTLEWTFTASYGGTLSSEGMGIGDIDGDSEKEIVYAPRAWENNSLLVLSLNGNLENTISVGNSVDSLDVGDINNDGVEDIVIGQSGGNVSLVYGNGSIGWTYETFDEVYHVTIGNLDPDSDNEVIAESRGYWGFSLEDSKTHTIDNNGELLWQKNNTHNGAVYEVNCIRIADVDDDGINEAIIGEGNNLIVYSRDGSVEWSYAANLEFDSIDIADIDNDGKGEIIAGAADVYVFKEGTKFWSYDSGFLVYSLEAGDLDGDGLNEIVVGDENKVHVYENNGSLKWSIAMIGKLLALDDLDYDGIDEIAVKSGSNVVVYDGYRNLLLNVSVGHYIEEMAVGNIDLTPEKEIVVAGFTYPGSNITAVHHNGSIKWRRSVESGHINSIVIGNVDNDSINEIVAGGSETYLFNGNGTLELTEYTGYVAYDSISLADVDGDEISDIVVGTTSQVIVVYGGDGTEIQYDTENAVCSTAVGDIDDDGLKEVIATDGDSNGSLYVLEDSGDLKWQHSEEYPMGKVIVEDIDNDGVEDIIAVTTDLYCFNQDGSVRWSYDPGSMMASLGYTIPLTTTDTDSDGISDIIVGGLGVHVVEVNYGTPATTTTIFGECPLAGDTPPCGVIELSEVIDLINQWAAYNVELSEVIDLINAWAAG